jgi:hypothetical protein
MKYILVILSVFLFSACSSNKGPKTTSKTDTTKPMNVLYHIQGGNYQMALGRYTLTETKILDTLEDKGKVVSDTNWIILIANTKDTVRDINNKPKYDSASRQYIFNQIWYPIKGVEKQTVRVQIVTI